MNELELRVKRFADSRWPKRDLAGRVRKLGEEFGELAEAVARLESVSNGHGEIFKRRNHVAEEAADCAIILSDIVGLLGLSLEDVVRLKLAIVEQRP